MAESSFPGTNPFAPAAGQRGMQTLSEEVEPDTATAASSAPAPPPASSATTAPVDSTTTSGSMNATQQHMFGSSGGAGLFGGFALGSRGGGGGSTSAPPAAGSLPQDYNYNRRTSVSAESMAPAGVDDDSWTPPVFAKTDEQVERLRQAVSPNFLFSHLDDEQTAQVLAALKEKPVPARGIKVIEQGDVGDYFYVVERGSFDIHVNASGRLEPGLDGMGTRVATIAAGGSFGELALMYNAPRAATVVSTEPSTLWQLDRVTFRRILMDNAFQRRRLYESFLAEVPLLRGLTDYERSKIADALDTTRLPPGSTIIQEGDPGETFFILETGEAEAFKAGTDGPVKRYARGDYFGELALLNRAPRAASVVSKSAVKLAMLGKEGFQRLMGPVEDVMRRDDPTKAVPAAVTAS